MKTLIVIMLCFFSTQSFAQTQSKALFLDSTKSVATVETACGECQLGLSGHGCDLAVRIDGKAYFVDGTNINDHGDAHAKDGFCNAIRKANVQGELVKGRYQVSYFKLVANP